MFKKFKDINAQMDEMLQAKQNQIATNTFWWSFSIAILILFFQTIIMNNSLMECLPLFIVILFGAVYYTVGIWKAHLPLVPTIKRRTILSSSLIVSITFGLAVGIRNVYFLYADNISSNGISRLLSCIGISIIMTISILVICLIVYNFLYRLSIWQEKRIQNKIDRENED